MNFETYPHDPSSEGPDQARIVFAEGVSVSFAGRKILDGVDITLNRGEIVTLIGLNGSGKSTLAKILLGLLRPDSGRVWRAEHLRHGYVPQSMAINSAMPITLRRFLPPQARTSTGRRKQAPNRFP